MKSQVLKAALRGATCISAFVIAAPAFAQEAPAEQPPAADESITAPNTTASSDSEETIVVTGSRIRRSEFNSPDPVAIVSPELSRAQGQFNTAEMLQNSPVAAGSSQVTAAISSAFVENGGVGVETVSLRGLGANRTLVLMNGRRAGPAGTRGAISAFDLNVLPQSIIKNVEILKTGASSIYGSDAVAGVINLITKTDTNGLELDGFASVPMQSGGEQYRLTATWGKQFDRGHIMATIDYNKRVALERKDRDYLDCPEEYVFNSAGDRVDIIDPRTGKPRCNDTLWGQVWTYDRFFRRTGLYQFSYPGDNLGNYIPVNATPGLTVPNGFYRVTFTSAAPALPAGSSAADILARQKAMLSVQNVYHPFMSASSVIPETQRLSAYVDASYEVSDNLKIGTELLFNNRKNKVTSYRQFYYLTGYTNTPISPSFPNRRDPFSPGWEGRYYLSPTAITDHSGVRIDNDYYRGLLWADGNFGGFLEGWNYNAYLQYSKSIGRYETDIIYKDAVDLHDYRTSSCVGQTLLAGQPCIDLNWNTPDFLAGNLTAAERGMLFGVDKGRTTYDQLVAEFSMSGKIIDLPAGPFQAAFGGALRTDKINDVPGVETRRGNSWGLTGAGITAGKTRTWEAFAEVDVPVIHSTPLIQSFNISASGRVTNVKATRASDGATDNSTGNWTYSVGANWEVTDWLRFRARYGTSFRAPALFEQFLSNQTSFLAQRGIDPCIDWANSLANGSISQRVADNCRTGTSTIPGVPSNHSGAGVNATVITGGGLGVLDPETSTARTASVILTPKFDFLPNTKINIAVDYFDIRIKGEIATLGPASIIGGCYSSEFFPDEPLCRLFTRFPETSASQFNIQTATATFININSQRNEGLDLTVDIDQDLGKLGSVRLLAQMNWQFKSQVELFGGTLLENNGESGEPKWVGDFNLIWSPTDTLQIFYGLDVIGPTSEEQDYIDINGGLCRNFTAYGEVCPVLTTPTVFYHSLSATKEFADGKFELTAGVRNLFDKKPPRVTVEGSNQLNSNTISTVGKVILESQYDYIGRSAFVSFRAKF